MTKWNKWEGQVADCERQKLQEMKSDEIDFRALEEMLLIHCTWSGICAVLKADTRTIAEAVREKYGESLQEYQFRHRQISEKLILGKLREHAKTSKSTARFLKSINIGPLEQNLE